MQLLGACSIDSLESATEQLNAGQQPLPLCSPGQNSLEELAALWCTCKVSISCEHAVPQLDMKPAYASLACQTKMRQCAALRR